MENKVEYKTFWTTADLAKAAKVSDSYIRQLLRRGEIRGQRARREWIISDSEARRWLETHNREE